jgi:hypothetical protein
MIRAVTPFGQDPTEPVLLIHFRAPVVNVSTSRFLPPLAKIGLSSLRYIPGFEIHP